jgi:hypothetical protein
MQRLQAIAASIATTHAVKRACCVPAEKANQITWQNQRNTLRAHHAKSKKRVKSCLWLVIYLSRAETMAGDKVCMHACMHMRSVATQRPVVYHAQGTSRALQRSPCRGPGRWFLVVVSAVCASWGPGGEHRRAKRVDVRHCCVRELGGFGKSTVGYCMPYIANLVAVCCNRCHDVKPR